MLPDRDSKSVKVENMLSIRDLDRVVIFVGKRICGDNKQEPRMF